MYFRPGLATILRPVYEFYTTMTKARLTEVDLRSGDRGRRPGLAAGSRSPCVALAVAAAQPEPLAPPRSATPRPSHAPAEPRAPPRRWRLLQARARGARPPPRVRWVRVRPLGPRRRVAAPQRHAFTLSVRPELLCASHTLRAARRSQGAGGRRQGLRRRSRRGRDWASLHAIGLRGAGAGAARAEEARSSGAQSMACRPARHLAGSS